MDKNKELTAEELLDRLKALSNDMKPSTERVEKKEPAVYISGNSNHSEIDAESTAKPTPMASFRFSTKKSDKAQQEDDLLDFGDISQYKTSAAEEEGRPPTLTDTLTESIHRAEEYINELEKKALTGEISLDEEGIPTANGTESEQEVTEDSTAAERTAAAEFAELARLAGLVAASRSEEEGRTLYDAEQDNEELPDIAPFYNKEEAIEQATPEQEAHHAPSADEISEEVTATENYTENDEAGEFDEIAEAEAEEYYRSNEETSLVATDNVDFDDDDLAVTQGEDGLTLSDGAEDLGDAANPDFSDLDESDVNLMMIFNMQNELESQLGKEKVKEIRKDIDDAGSVVESDNLIEYDSTEQNDEFMRRYNKRYASATIRLLLSLSLLALVFLFEFFIEFTGGSLPNIVNSNVEPIFHLIFVLQLTLLCGAVAFREMSHGAISISRGRFTPEAVLLFSFILNILHQISALAFGEIHGTTFFVLPLAFGAFLTMYYTRINLKREIVSFRIISSARPKFAVSRLSAANSELEAEAFSNHLEEGDHIFGISRSNFISNFAKRNAREPSYSGTTSRVVFFAAFLALITFALGFYFDEVGGFFVAITTAHVMLMFALPLSAFLTYSFPFYSAARKAAHTDSAIIGEASLEEYANASVISFNDRDIFPPQGVKVKSMRLYGKDTRIDTVLYNIGSAYNKLGGPLSDVFAVATKDIGHSKDVDIIEMGRGGVHLAVDGISVHMGNFDYMRGLGFEPSVDADDPTIMRERQISIMHVSIGGTLASKLYVDYRMDPECVDIIKSLYKSGMCLGIKTLDPNIDDVMLDQRVPLSKYPIRILRCNDNAQITTVEESLDSGVVSRRSAKSLLKTIAMCNRVLQIIKMNGTMKHLAVVAAAVITVGIVVLGTITAVPSIYVVLFQLFWMLPVVVFTKLYL